MSTTFSSLIAGYPNAPSASRGFVDLVKAVSETKSKYEEDRIIAKEAYALKSKITNKDISKKAMRECLVRLIYCEMLGHEVPYGYIHAVNLTQSQNLYEKRVGYLAVSLFLHPNHELMILLINTLQRDLKSSNWIEASAALTVLCKLINAEMIPAVQSLVEAKLSDAKDSVRKKAVMALHRFYLVDASYGPHFSNFFRKALSDKSPSVVAASLHAFYDMSIASPSSIKDLIPHFVSVLKQVIEGRLGSEYNYHNVPAPWVQIKLLQILATLGVDDKRSSEGMYEVLSLALSRAESGTHAGYAVVYECIRTITSIYPNVQVIEHAAKSAGRFLAAGNNNLRYLGITALAMIVQVNPSFAVQHQLVVIECLDDPDETLKRKTLDLLYKMTNPQNVVVIVDKMIAYLRSTVDVFLRTDLVSRITQLTERYAPNNAWFIQTMNAILELGGELVRPEVAHNLMLLIAEGTEDEEADKELRLYAVDSYLALLERPRLPEILIHITCWVLGEYCYVAEDVSKDDVIDRFVGWLDKEYQDIETRGWIITAIMKLVAQGGAYSEAVQDVIEKFMRSQSADIQQRCVEFKQLVKTPDLMKQLLPVDSSCEDLEVDGYLSFLDGYVAKKLSFGAQRYLRPSERPSWEKPTSKIDDLARKKSTLNFEPYEKPASPAASASRVNILSNPAPVLTGFATSQGSFGTQRLPVAAPTQQSQPQPAAVSPQQSALFAGIPHGAAAAPTPAPTSASAAVLSPRPSASASPVATAITSELQVGGKKIWGKSGLAHKAQETAPESPRSSQPEFAAPNQTITRASSQPSIPAAIPAPRTPEPPKPSAEDLRKQKLAAELFGGVPSSSPAAHTSSPRAGGTPNATRSLSSANMAASGTGMRATSSSPSTPLSRSRNDLLLVDFDAPAPQQQQQQQQQQQSSTGFLEQSAPPAVFQHTSPMDDLLGLDPIPTTSTKVSAPAPAPVATTTSNTLSASGLSLGFMPAKSTSNASLGAAAGFAKDLEGDMSLLGGAAPGTPTAAPAPAKPAPAPFVTPSFTPSFTPSYSNSNSVQSGLFSGPLPVSAASSVAPAPASSLPASLQRFPNSIEAKKELCSDLNLSVSYFKIWKDDELVLVLYHSNRSSGDVLEVQTAVNASDNLDVFVDDASIGAFFDAAIRPGDTTRHAVGFKIKSVAANFVFSGTITYRLAALGQRSLTFNVALLMSDFLRPLRLSTPQYGSKWPTMKQERKQRITQASARTPQELMERLRTQVNMHPVEIIGLEGIAAGSILQTNHFCLLHSKIPEPGTIDISIRSTDMSITDKVLALVVATMK